jgi:antitoxin StbD
METIYADRTVSISEFKRNPGRIMTSAAGKPIAVLKNNRPDFYAVPSALFEQLADILDDLMIADEVRARVDRGDFVDVELEDL